MPVSDHYVGMRLPEEMVRLAKLAASQEDRSLSKYIKLLIKRDLERRGVLPTTGFILEDPVTYGKKSDRKRGT